MAEPRDPRRLLPKATAPQAEPVHGPVDAGALPDPGASTEPVTDPDTVIDSTVPRAEVATTEPIGVAETVEAAAEQDTEIRQMLRELLAHIPAEALSTAEEACQLRTRLIDRRLYMRQKSTQHYDETIRSVLSRLNLTMADYEAARIIVTVPAEDYPKQMQVARQQIREQIMDPIDDELRHDAGGLRGLFPDPKLHRADLYQISYEYVSAYKLLEKLRDGGRDSLTGFVNDQGFLSQMFEVQMKLLALLEEDRAMVVVRMDLDGFKSINDNWGHEVGDKILREFAAALRQQFQRQSDIMTIIPDRDSRVEGRPGGDEFALIVQDVNTQQRDNFDASDYQHFPADLLKTEGIGSRWLFNVAVRIMRAANSVIKPDGQPLTVSIGMARIHQEEASRMLYGNDDNYPMVDFAEYSRRADEAATRAKNWGNGVAQEWGPKRPPVPMTRERVQRKLLKGLGRDFHELELREDPRVAAMLDALAELFVEQYEKLQPGSTSTTE